MYKYAIAISLFQLMLSCRSSVPETASIQREFHIPVVVQPPFDRPAKNRKADFLTYADFQFIDKFKFTDTIFLKEESDGYIEAKRLIPQADMIHERSMLKPKDSLSTDGFQIIPDYRTSIYQKKQYHGDTSCYFPVYVVNETSSTKVFFAKDRYVFAIQEAIDVDPERWGFWYPIESVSLDFCGNGNFGVKVHPGEFIMFLVPKYEGEEKNAMRIRLQIGESLYISRSYEGTYSTKQFNLSKEAWYYKYLKGSKDCSTFDNFYGAVPKEFDRH